MKKCLFIIFSILLLVININVYSQSRISQEKPQFLSEKSGILNKAIGWAYDKNIGEWIDYNNAITTNKSYKTEYKSLLGSGFMMSMSMQNFVDFQTRSFIYKDIKYYLLVVRKWVGWYEYPSLEIDWQTAIKIKGYIFTSSEYNKLYNIKGLVSLIPIAETWESLYDKYNDTAFADDILKAINEYHYPGVLNIVFPILLSEEGLIRFDMPKKVYTDNKNPYYNNPFNFNERYFETTFEEFSKIIIK